MPAILNRANKTFDPSRREFIKKTLTAGLFAALGALGIGQVLPHTHPFVNPDRLLTRDSSVSPYILIYTDAGDAVAVLFDGRTYRGSDHAAIIQKVFDEVDNYAKSGGVRVIFWPRDRAFRIARSLHLPCENGGYWHLEGTVSGQSRWGLTAPAHTPVFYYVGEGPIIENDGAYGFYTSVTIENLDVFLNSKKATGFKITSLMHARNIYVEYNGGLGAPEVRNYGLAVANGNVYSLMQIWVRNCCAGIISMGGEHGLWAGIDVTAAPWTEFGFLVPHDVGWAPIDALQDAGYPINGDSRHHVLIDCHFFKTGKLDIVTTPSGYRFAPCAFRVAASLLFFSKIEGDIHTLYQGDWGGSYVVGHYYSGSNLYKIFKYGGILITSHLAADPIVPWPQEVAPNNWTYLLNHVINGPLIISSYIKGLVTPIVSGVVSVSAGGTYTVARFTVPSGRKLLIHTIFELYDPDNSVYSEIYDVTDGITVASVDGFSDAGWSVGEGKIVEFRLVNIDTVNAHDANYAFLISLL